MRENKAEFLSGHWVADWGAKGPQDITVWQVNS